MPTYNESQFVDVISSRLEKVIAAGANLPAEFVFLSLTSPVILSKHPVAESFVTTRPASMSMNMAMTAGAGRPHHAIDSVWTITVFSKVGSDQEYHDTQQFRRSGLNLVTRTLAVHKAVQLNDLASDGDANSDNKVSPLREPMRVLGMSFSPRTPETGCAWCDIQLSINFRVDLGS